MIGKQVLAFGKSEKSEFINIGIFAASSGGRKGRLHIGRFTPDRERSHVCYMDVVKQRSNAPSADHSYVRLYSLRCTTSSGPMELSTVV